MIRKRMVIIQCLLVLVMVWLLCPQLCLGTEHSTSPEAGSSEGHGGGHEVVPWYKSMNTWKAINLAVLLVVLYKLLAVPISRFLSERSFSIEEALKNAELQSKTAQEEFGTMQAKLDAAKDEIEKIIAKGREDATRAVQNIQESTAQDIETLQKRAVDELDQEVLEAKQELVAFVASEAIVQARKKVETYDRNKLQAAYLRHFQATLKPQGGNGEGP